MSDEVPLRVLFSNDQIEQLYGQVCDLCSKFIKRDEPEWPLMRQVMHWPRRFGPNPDPESISPGRTLILCDFCRTQSRCNSLVGIHGEVYTLEPDDDNGWYAWRIWEKIGVKREFGPGMPNHSLLGRLGVCSKCEQPMMWDISLQRWTDADDLGDEYWTKVPKDRGIWYIDHDDQPVFLQEETT